MFRGERLVPGRVEFVESSKISEKFKSSTWSWPHSQPKSSSSFFCGSLQQTVDFYCKLIDKYTSPVGGMGCAFHVFQQISRWCFQIFCFSPLYLGEWSNLTHFFQVGWNQGFETLLKEEKRPTPPCLFFAWQGLCFLLVLTVEDCQRETVKKGVQLAIVGSLYIPISAIHIYHRLLILFPRLDILVFQRILVFKPETRPAFFFRLVHTCLCDVTITNVFWNLCEEVNCRSKFDLRSLSCDRSWFISVQVPSSDPFVYFLPLPPSPHFIIIHGIPSH